MDVRKIKLRAVEKMTILSSLLFSHLLHICGVIDGKRAYNCPFPQPIKEQHK